MQLIQKRRAFLQYLNLPLFDPAALQAAQAETQPIAAQELLQTSPVRGHLYHPGPHVLDWLRVGERIDLVAESGNPYDEFAVRVEWRGAHLGYLPRERNHQVSRLLRGIGRDGHVGRDGASTALPGGPVSLHAIVRDIDRERPDHPQPVTVDVVGALEVVAIQQPQEGSSIPYHD